MSKSVLLRIGVTVRLTPDVAAYEHAVDVPLPKRDSLALSSGVSVEISLPATVGLELTLRPDVSPTIGPDAPVPCVIWAVVGGMLRSVSARCITGPVSPLE